MEKKQCDIRIQVATSYVDDESEPESDRYVFAYTITISNSGEVSAQLISRHWIITDANGKVQEVNGDGVVGEQPKLNPGEEFRYSSGAVLETPVGAMQGLYRMKTDGDVSFDALIAPFTLAVPGLLN
jgi:ApaG protein